jgi:hypothetical protein
MSLTSFLKIPNVRAKFTETFPFKAPKLSGELLAPSQTKNYSLIGTAFDYLLRFQIERLNPNTVKQTWIAELGVEKTMIQPKIYKTLKAIIMATKAPYSDFVKNGKLSESLFASTIVLAKLDMIYRIGRIEPNILDYKDEDIIDLKNLLSIVNDSLFKSKKFCTLNPNFEDASLLVGGADADMIIDDTLIDIKTVKDLKFQKDHYHQLIGYYILSKLGNVDGMNDKINNIGIYFSRYGILHTISVTEIDENPKFDSFVKWFEKEAAVVFDN